ncbi:DNA polymerase III subunit beta [Candidatus Kaiserbacteria bacterium CG10_big_fil_rev_8_21_14_0_10_49_17]|uniref:Beta sliding clamp n=1 Tax=Candidatus Kaiserbacteria bacterium CG10_big_fil_rev_8_21_14_0_10_49_17 TaxID=1974609 RepID=A0A2M6WED2_9BACT|nr:MAG: DNA polymerase III subunit beta [Candidatus Kaiserbacteria bacterium CG10_big_fil_rev_8_21_14_0_10_49_17]
MIITVNKKEFSEAVLRTARFAERRSATLPVLTGIAIVAGDDGIKLRATNLETGIDLRISGKIGHPGVVVLPATTLREITSSFTDSGTLKLEHAGDTVMIDATHGRSTLKTLSPDDFPTIPFPDVPEVKFTLPGTSLKTLISTVAPCASPSSVRPELGSVLIESESNLIKAVATDSFRLAEKKISLSGKPTQFSILIPAKNALDIIQTLPDDDLEMLIDEHQCAFSWADGIVTTRLVTVPYPDYTQIIPKTFPSEATVLRKDFDAAIRRSSVFSDQFQKITLAFDVEKKKITFSARNSDIGESSEGINASLTGESTELSFNHRYLQTPLSLISAENLSLSAAGIGRPLIIKGTGDTSFLYLVMPMNQ